MRRHWLLVVAITIVAVGAAAFTVSRLDRHYQATASVLVNPLPNADPTLEGTGAVIDTSDPARTVETAAALVQSPQAAALTARRMGPGWSRGRVESAISVTPRGQSDVLAVTATAANPRDAARLANQYAATALAVRSQVVASNVGAELNALRARQGSTSTGAAAASSVQQQNLNDVIGKLQTVLDTHRDPSLSVLAPAQAPGSASGAPRWLIILLAALAGLALGSVAALAIEYFNRRIRDARDVQAVFPEPILAGIPKVGARRTRLRRGRRALSPLDMPPQAFEQMRLLRTQLLAPAYGRVIMVTSADAGDGKTSVAAALAGAFSEGGRDVILLDADVLKPDAATVFGLPGANQDAEPADATTSLADLLVHVPGLPHVEVLRSPPGDMASLEMLISRLPELIDEATQLADRVIVDTPPVVEVSDSLRIAPECDSVVVVVRPRHTDRSRLALARDKLLRTGANVVGTVLVGESVVKLADTYYSYGYGYAPQQGKDEPAAEKSGASRRRAGEAVPNGAAPQPRVLHPDRP